MRPLFTVFRNNDAWVRFGPFGGWDWASTSVVGPQSTRFYMTACGARRAAERATRNNSKEQQR